MNKKPDPKPKLKLVAIRELTAGDYGPVYKVGDQVQCPCDRKDHDVAKLQLDENGATIYYKDGSKLVLQAPVAALYRAAKPEPVQGLEPEAPQPAAEALAEAPVEAPEDRPPPGFTDSSVEGPAQTNADITSPNTG